MRAAILLLSAAVTLTACNTVQGVGRDIHDAGVAVEKGAKKVERAITE
ncbi:MAG: entericidin [Pseudomonadota bacterium]